MWPKSAVVTFTFPFQCAPHISNASAQLAVANPSGRTNGSYYYSQAFELYPYRPLRLQTTDPANYWLNSDATTVFSWLRYMGAAGTGSGANPTVYSRCLPLKVEYDLKLAFTCFGTTVNFVATELPYGALPSTHLLLPLKKTVTAPTTPTTQTILSELRAYPRIKEKIVGQPYGYGNYNNGNGNETTFSLPGQQLQWKGVSYPFEDYGQTFADWVSDDSNYGTWNAAGNCSTLYLYGSFPDLSTSDYPGLAPNCGIIIGNFKFTCLLKDVVGTLS